MKRALIFLLLFLSWNLFGQASYQRNSFTTNSPPKFPLLLPVPSASSNAYPVVHTDFDETILEWQGIYFSASSNAFLRGILSAYGGAFSNSLTLNGVAVSTNNGAAGTTNYYSTLYATNLVVSNLITTNLTVVNNLTVSNLYTVNGHHNTLTITNALTPSQIGASKLAGTEANGILTNVTLSGDVTTSSGGLVTTIANNAVTYAKMQDVSATARAIGRNTAGSGDPEEITGTQILDWIGSTRGSVLYRGASGWTQLVPNTAGYVLTDGGVGADPTWAAVTAFVGIYRDQSIEAGAMFAGPTAATTGTYTNTVNDTLSDSWTFADAATQSTRFALTLPDTWNIGTIKLKLYVTCDGTNTATTTNLVWGVKAGSLAPLEALTNAVFGTQVFVTNGLATNGNTMQVFTTPAITVGGSPATGDSLWFDISRQGSNSSDTWTNTVVLLKCRVQWKESNTAPSIW